MGYRSEVRSVIYGPDDKMAAFIAFAEAVTDAEGRRAEYAEDLLRLGAASYTGGFSSLAVRMSRPR